MNINETAVKFLRQSQRLVSVGDNGYVFMVRANISMAWVKNEDVDKILNMKISCCGGQNRHGFVLANEDDIRRWTNGGGR